jgi:hypothetical protein
VPSSSSVLSGRALLKIGGISGDQVKCVGTILGARLIGGRKPAHKKWLLRNFFWFGCYRSVTSQTWNRFHLASIHAHQNAIISDVKTPAVCKGVTGSAERSVIMQKAAAA